VSAAKSLRMTLQTQMVLRVILANPTSTFYGLELTRSTTLASGTIHPILARLETAGWLESYWEDVDPNAVGRPRRRFYRLTTDGVEQARSALARTAKPSTPESLRPVLGQGGA